MTNQLELAKKQKAIRIRGGIELWLDEEKADLISEILIKSNERFIRSKNWKHLNQRRRCGGNFLAGNNGRKNEATEWRMAMPTRKLARTKRKMRMYRQKPYQSQMSGGRCLLRPIRRVAVMVSSRMAKTNIMTYLVKK